MKYNINDNINLYDTLHSCYFTTVYHILKEAGSKELARDEFNKLIYDTSERYGFSETSLYISNAIKYGEESPDKEPDKCEDKDAWGFFDKECVQKPNEKK